jgi:outer membrane lipoprotein SlyB
LGAIIGALASDSHSWWGAAIGATAGLVVGMLVGDAMDQQEQQNAEIRAAQTNQTVVIHDQSNNAAKVEPYGQSTVSYNNNMRTECQKVKTTVWRDGKQVSEEINEVCTSTKTTATY